MACHLRMEPPVPSLPLPSPPLPSAQVSWLGAWALLLGCRDHKTLQGMVHCKLPCLRPSEEDMLCVYREWARIAPAAEVSLVRFVRPRGHLLVNF